MMMDSNKYDSRRRLSSSSPLPYEFDTIQDGITLLSRADAFYENASWKDPKSELCHDDDDKQFSGDGHERMAVQNDDGNDDDDNDVDVDVDDVDDLTTIVKEGSRGVALYAVNLLSVSMALLSIFMTIQLRYRFQSVQQHDAMSNEATNMGGLIPHVSAEYSGSCYSDPHDDHMEGTSTTATASSTTTASIESAPVWQQLLEFQIDALQNLLHAALLGAAAWVAALRGDVLWMYYVRNTALFFVLFSTAYVAVDGYRYLIDDGGVNYNDGRIFLAVSMAITSWIALLFLQPTFWAVQHRLVHRRQHLGSIHDDDDDDDKDNHNQPRGILPMDMLSHKNCCGRINDPENDEERVHVVDLTGTTARDQSVLLSPRAAERHHPLPAVAERPLCEDDTWYYAQRLFRCAMVVQYSAILYVVTTVVEWFWMMQNSLPCGENSTVVPFQLMWDPTTDHHHSRRVEAMFEPDNDQPDMDNDLPGMSSSSKLLSFEMAYSVGAHQALLLALLLLAATYPRDRPSVGGALLSGGWRLSVSGSSLAVLAWHWTEKTSLAWSSSSSLLRNWLSLLFTSLEAGTMLVVVITSIRLLHKLTAEKDFRISRQATTIPDPLGERPSAHYSKINDGSGIQTVKVRSSDRSVENNEDDEDSDTGDTEALRYDQDGTEPVSASSHALPSTRIYQKHGRETLDYLTTAAQIAQSTSFSCHQRWGAYLLSKATVALLVGMTTECIVLLSQVPITSSKAATDIYKWGMHICSIYLACVVMSTETPSIYGRFRILLGFASPVGSLFAGWQLFLLWTYSSSTWDLWTGIIALLFVWRALCGLVQCVGLMLLNETVPSSPNQQRSCMESPYQPRQQQYTIINPSCHDRKLVIAEARQRAFMSLIFGFLPCFAAYVLVHILLSTCRPPMIAAMIPSNSIDRHDGCFSHHASSSMQDVMLAQNWPGLGLLFHYGMMLVIFASDGLAADGQSSYRPSLTIASLFARQASILIAAHMVWDSLQTDGWHDLSLLSTGLLYRFVLLLWMTSSAYLGHCLHTVWILRDGMP